MCIVYERFPIVVVFLVLKFDVLTLSSNIREDRKFFAVLVVCVLMLASKCLTITYCFGIASSKNEEDVENSKIFQTISCLLCCLFSCHGNDKKERSIRAILDLSVTLLSPHWLISRKLTLDLLSFRPN